MNAADVFLAAIGPVTMALIAVGALLFIKIQRRHRVARSHPQQVYDAVPAAPMSHGQAQRIIRGYLWTAAVIVGLMLLLALLLLGSAAARA